jgi:hypothetical protein
MPMSVEPDHSPGIGTSFALWAGCLTGPVAWFVQLEVAYALAAVFGVGSRPFLHVLSMVCLLATAYGCWIAWREWGKAGRAWSSPADEGLTARVRLMGALGVLTCLLSAALILAQWIAIVFLDPRAV